MPTKERTQPKKLLLVANVVKEHVLKFHVPTIKALKARGWTVDVAASGEEDRDSALEDVYQAVFQPQEEQEEAAETAAAPESGLETLQDLGIDLERGVYLEQLHDALLAALERLPERQRRIVWLRYFENLPGEEIARQLGITPGNVRVLLSRALDRLSADKSGNWKEYTYHG